MNPTVGRKILCKLPPDSHGVSAVISATVSRVRHGAKWIVWLNVTRNPKPQAYPPFEFDVAGTPAAQTASTAITDPAV